MATKISSIYTLITADDSPLKRGLARARSESVKGAKNIQSALNKINFKAVSLGAVAMGGTIAFATKKFVDMAVEQENAEKRLGAVLKSTGQAAGFNLDQMKAMASAMQDVTTTGDEVILSGQAMLATFKQIRGEAFERATMAALDLSEVMQQDLRSSIVQIGKALNDPIANLGALGRAGIQFTKQQKDVIKSLWEQGRAAEAQNIILEEMESQFGGAAKAARETFGGAMKSVSNTLGDIGEQIGFAVMDPLKDLVDEFAIWIKTNETLLKQDIPGFIGDIGKAAVESLKFIAALNRGLDEVAGGAVSSTRKVFLESLKTEQAAVLRAIDELARSNMPFGTMEKSLKRLTSRYKELDRQIRATVEQQVDVKLHQFYSDMDRLVMKSGESTKGLNKQIGDTNKLIEKQVGLNKLRFAPRASRGKTAPRGGGMVGAMGITAMAEAEKRASAESIGFASDRAMAYRNMYEDIGDQSKKYYSEQIKSLQGQKEAYVKLTKDKALAEQWFSNEYEKLLIEQQRRSDDFIKGMSAGFKQLTREQYMWGQAGYDIVQKFAASSRNVMSDVFFDHMTGEMDSLKSYWDQMWRSMVRAYSDALARMATEWAISGLGSLFFGGGGGGGGGIIDTVAGWIGSIFHKGGIVKAHNGLSLAGRSLRRDEIPIVAQSGEGILSRQGMRALGGEKFLDALNKGQSLNKPVNISYSFSINESDNPKSTVAEIERFIRSNRGRALMQYTTRGF